MARGATAARFHGCCHGLGIQLARVCQLGAAGIYGRRLSPGSHGSGVPAGVFPSGHNVQGSRQRNDTVGKDQR